MANSAIVLPPSTQGKQTPGVRPVGGQERLQTPGIRQDEAIEKPVEVVQDAVEKSKPVVLGLQSYPACGGRVPNIGDRVWFWQKDEMGRLRPFVADLFWFEPMTGRWSINLYTFGRVAGRNSIVFSETPMDCCWTWPMTAKE